MSFRLKVSLLCVDPPRTEQYTLTEAHNYMIHASFHNNNTVHFPLIHIYTMHSFLFAFLHALI